MVLLVVLHDDRCAILRNNEAIYQAAGDTDGIDGAVQRFMAMTQVSDVLGDDEQPPSVTGAAVAARKAELKRDTAGDIAPSPRAGAGGSGAGSAGEFKPPAATPGTSA